MIKCVEVLFVMMMFQYSKLMVAMLLYIYKRHLKENFLCLVEFLQLEMLCAGFTGNSKVNLN